MASPARAASLERFGEYFRALLVKGLASASVTRCPLATPVVVLILAAIVFSAMAQAGVRSWAEQGHFVIYRAERNARGDR